MQALQHLREILKTIAQDVEVPPAVGVKGCLPRADFLGRDDAAFGERIGQLACLT